jgi:hypothetical protein
MILDCQLKSLLKNYLKTIIVGFGQADALGFSSINWQKKPKKCSKLKFLKFEICKTFLNNKISTFYF